jgi:hypothetical protein
MLRIRLDLDDLSTFLLLFGIDMLLVRADGEYALFLDRMSMSNNREQHVFMKKSLFILRVSSAYFYIESHLLFRNLIQNP